MSLPTSRHSYLDCLSYFDQALEDPKGIRLRQDSIDAATHLRMRLHQLRKLLREDSKSVYESGDPQYGVTAYDNVVCRIRTVDQVVYLYLEQILISTEIEPLSEIDDLIAIAPPEPQRLLEDLNATDRNSESNNGNPSEPLATSLGAGDRDGATDGSEERTGSSPVRSPQSIRRI